MKFIRKIAKKENQATNSKDAAKERLHLVLMQDRANVSADFLELMKQEIIEVIKKYIEVDESAIDVRLTNKENGDGTNGAPALYANIPIINIKDEVRQNSKTNTKDNLDKASEHTITEEKNETETEEQKTLSQEKKEEIVTEKDQGIDNNAENEKEVVQEEKHEEEVISNTENK